MDKFSWAIGLYEGEGNANVWRTKAGSCGCRLVVTSTDLDILENFQKAVECGSIIPTITSDSHLGRKPIWTWKLGTQSEIKVLLENMMPYLGNRRKHQALTVLDFIHRKRLGPPSLPGELASRAKFTNAEAKDIRERYLAGGITQQTIADEFGVTQGTISAIVLEKAYAS
jgi:hypothetical protein